VRGYDREWRAIRARHLSDRPACARCGSRTRLHVDHVRPHRGIDALRLDPANLQTLCVSCHSRKTATADGGFGRV